MRDSLVRLKIMFGPIRAFLMFLAIAMIAVLSPVSSLAEERTWTRGDGKTVVGELRGIENGQISILLKGGRIMQTAVAGLSLDDQQYVKGWAPRRPLHIPEEAKFHNGSWFLVVKQGMSWKQASEKAKKMGGRLVSVDSEQEQAFITELIPRGYFWIGGSDAEKEGVWKWTNGEAIEFTAWDGGQPSDSDRKEHYIQVRPGGKWNDHSGDGAGNTGFVMQWDE